MYYYCSCLYPTLLGCQRVRRHQPTPSSSRGRVEQDCTYLSQSFFSVKCRQGKARCKAIDRRETCLEGVTAVSAAAAEEKALRSKVHLRFWPCTAATGVQQRGQLRQMYK
ncbi:hypothetical protein TYRP_012817 [Tyrophagus putrescentiae]|nr:hypothetical protein TYRP_012817 [Tyrophagus putrescentiae]